MECYCSPEEWTLAPHRSSELSSWGPSLSSANYFDYDPWHCTPGKSGWVCNVHQHHWSLPTWRMKEGEKKKGRINELRLMNICGYNMKVLMASQEIQNKLTETSLLLTKDQDVQQLCNIYKVLWIHWHIWWTHLNFIGICVIVGKKLLSNWLDLDKHPRIKMSSQSSLITW